MRSAIIAAMAVVFLGAFGARAQEGTAPSGDTAKPAASSADKKADKKGKKKHHKKADKKE